MLRRWKKGDDITRDRIQSITQAITRRIRGGNDILVRRQGDRIIIDSTVEQSRRRSGGGGGSAILEVVIAKAIAVLSDALGDREIDAFTAYGPHLKCHGVDANGDFILEDFEGDIVVRYFIVFPNWRHPVAEFKQVPWNYLRPDAPIFTAVSGARGLTLSFGEGERWTMAPTEAALCSKSPTTTACCLPNESCQQLTSEACLLAGGTPIGIGTTCFIVDCTAAESTGACCYGNGLCSFGMQSDCSGLAGSFFPGFDCDQVPCSLLSGACCYPNGSCQQLSAASCQQAFGDFQGAGSNCSSNPCMPVTGSCCNGASCTATSQAACTGDWTMGGVCSPNPCMAPAMAVCCSNTGFGCSITTQAGCVGGTWLPSQTNCGTSPCVGACCYGVNCGANQYFHQCTGGGGVWQGHGSTCFAGQCP